MFRAVTTWVYKPEAANTVSSSWWWAVCRSKHIKPSLNFGINSITSLHLVGYLYWFVQITLYEKMYHASFSPSTWIFRNLLNYTFQSVRLCCVQVNKCSLFGSQHNLMVSIQILKYSLCLRRKTNINCKYVICPSPLHISFPCWYQTLYIITFWSCQIYIPSLQTLSLLYFFNTLRTGDADLRF